MGELPVRQIERPFEAEKPVHVESDYHNGLSERSWY